MQEKKKKTSTGDFCQVNACIAYAGLGSPDRCNPSTFGTYVKE